jgi:hypothetical protein
VTVTIEGLDELRASFATLDRDLQRATGVAVIGAVDAAREYARTEHRYKSRSENGLEANTGGRIISVTDRGTTGEIFALKPYASLVNNGTEAHMIEPKRANDTTSGRANVLRWEASDGVHFARRVMHPGTAPDPFMTKAGEFAERTLEVLMERETDRACEKV